MANAHDANDAIVRNYIERVFELRQTPQQSFGQSDLDAIALDLGLSSDELAAIQQQVDQDVDRARHLLTYDRWDDALACLETPITLRPFDPELLYLKAKIYADRYYRDRNPSDLATAQTIAHQCLALQADYTPGLKLVQRLDQTPPTVGRGWRVPVVLSLTVTPLIGLILFSLWITTAGSGDSPTPTPPIASPDLPTEPEPAPEGNTQSALGVTDEVDIPVEFAPTGTAQGIQIDPRLSRLNNYPDSSFYTLQAVLVNQTRTELRGLKLKVEYLDASGRAIAADSIDALPDYNAPLRPQDQATFDLIHESQPTLARLRLTVQTLDQTPAAQQYPVAKPVEVLWAFEPPPTLQFQIRQRSEQLRNSSLSPGQAYHEAIFEVTNTGEVAITRLKLQLILYDSQGHQQVVKDVLAIYGRDAPLLPHETRVEKTLTEVSSDYARYTLTVLEAD